MSRVRLRQAMPSEGEELAHLNHRCWVQTYAPLLPDNGWQQRALANRIRTWEQLVLNPDPDRKITVALLDDALVGIAWARIATDPGAVRDLELYGLYVLAECHGTGVGQALLDDVLGVESAMLWVAERNDRARAFYRRNGFTDDDQRDVHLFGPGAALDVVRMSR